MVPELPSAALGAPAIRREPLGESLGDVAAHELELLLAHGLRRPEQPVRRPRRGPRSTSRWGCPPAPRRPRSSLRRCRCTAERAEGGFPQRTPRVMSRASSIPEMTSRRRPASSRARRTISSRFFASRTAPRRHCTDLGVVPPAQRAPAPQGREQPVGNLAGDDPGLEHPLARGRGPAPDGGARASRSRRRASSRRTALVPTSIAASTGSGTVGLKLSRQVTMRSDAQGRGLAGPQSSRHRHPSEPPGRTVQDTPSPVETTDTRCSSTAS